MSSSVYDIATDLIKFTGQSVFVTGRAGTGKTTLLRALASNIEKRAAVVAPTGVAALNAGGMTIHSLFQLPPQSFIPTDKAMRQLVSQQEMSAPKRKVLRELELLIIDEVSMVRADLLDAIDFVLRYHRHAPHLPFGGVQVIYFGDMYQLPPVDKDLMMEYYSSPFFFSAKVIEQQPPIIVELDHIFRAKNHLFVELLHHIRNNTMNAEMYAVLERCYKPDFVPDQKDGYIILTTHNRRCDEINTTHLNNLKGQAITYTAEIKDNFPENIYPTDCELKLKKGARVMSLVNDNGPERRYYNGKLGTVVELNDDFVEVQYDGDEMPVVMTKNVWENKTYRTTQEGDVETLTVGTFVQYPLRLAWAVTIHKSQGLTFEKLVVDAGRAFASGQVYVALSRGTTLDGIVLTSRINNNSLALDRRVVEYCNGRVAVTELEKQLEVFKRQYNIELLTRLFTFEPLYDCVKMFESFLRPLLPDFTPQTQIFLDELVTTTDEIYKVGNQFITELSSLGGDYERLCERVRAAANYFLVRFEALERQFALKGISCESKVESEDFIDRADEVYDMLRRAIHMIRGMRDDVSVTHYFEVKHTYQYQPLGVSVYSVDIEEEVEDRVEEDPLLTALKQWRNKLCSATGKSPMQTFTDEALEQIVDLKPISPAELRKVNGVGYMKSLRYGDAIINIVKNYIKGKKG